jgi:NADH-quinone oxidoreductase subunit N
MSLALAAAHIRGPVIDWSALSPILVLSVGGLVTLLVGLAGSAVIRERVVPLITVVTLGGTIAREIVRLHHPTTLVAGSLRMDDLSLELGMLFCAAAIAVVLMSLRSAAPRSAGQGEYHGLLLFSVLGMTALVSAQNLVTVFLGIETLSIPLYVLCGSESRREGSLESGLKYLIIGSVGSATLLYGLALVYGITGSTDFASIGSAVSVGKLAGGPLGDPMLLTGLGLIIVGFAFKASVAPFHQWTPDVYEGAPTPITAFMATATKAAALGVFLRFFDVAAIGAQNDWAPVIAAVAAITIVVGNVGALGQNSLKRMLGYSGVGQAGYMLAGVVVGTQLGIQATVLYALAYLAMNLAAFAVIVAREETRPDLGDDLGSLAGLGARDPRLAWPMTFAMLALAGIPGTVGFVGKFQLIHALVDGNYTWLAIVLVIGSMISLGYYLRVVATMWMRPAVAPLRGAAAAATGPAGGLPAISGGSQEADPPAPVPGGLPQADAPTGDPAPADAREPHLGVLIVAAVFSIATIVFGIIPSPLFHFAGHAGKAIPGLF